MQNPVAIVRLDAVKHNAILFKNLTGARLCAVVKANAYGHGAIEIVSALVSVADFFAVATASEGQEILTAACDTPILVFTPPQTKSEAAFLVRNGLRITVSDLRSARLVVAAAKAQNKAAIVHLKINVGMNRYGADKRLAGKICKLLKSCLSWVEVEGAYGHLFEHTPAAAQAAKQIFDGALDVVKRYFSPVVAHLGATYAACFGNEYAYDMVRIGLGLYGYQPSQTPELSLKKALRVYASVTARRKVSFGGLGYGTIKNKQFESAKKRGVNVLRAGYADGFWDFADCFNRPCMDAMLVAGNRKQGARVCVFDDANAAAKRAGTIPYKALCDATKRAEFLYDGG